MSKKKKSEVVEEDLELELDDESEDGEEVFLDEEETTEVDEETEDNQCFGNYVPSDKFCKACIKDYKDTARGCRTKSIEDGTYTPKKKKSNKKEAAPKQEATQAKPKKKSGHKPDCGCVVCKSARKKAEKKPVIKETSKAKQKLKKLVLATPAKCPFKPGTASEYAFNILNSVGLKGINIKKFAEKLVKAQQSGELGADPVYVGMKMIAAFQPGNKTKFLLILNGDIITFRQKKSGNGRGVPINVDGNEYTSYADAVRQLGFEKRGPHDNPIEIIQRKLRNGDIKSVVRLS